MGSFRNYQTTYFYEIYALLTLLNFIFFFWMQFLFAFGIDINVYTRVLGVYYNCLYMTFHTALISDSIFVYICCRHGHLFTPCGESQIEFKKNTEIKI